VCVYIYIYIYIYIWYLTTLLGPATPFTCSRPMAKRVRAQLPVDRDKGSTSTALGHEMMGLPLFSPVLLLVVRVKPVDLCLGQTHSQNVMSCRPEKTNELCCGPWIYTTCNCLQLYPWLAGTAHPKVGSPLIFWNTAAHARTGVGVGLLMPFRSHS
jgi:hypothetical protein